MSQDPIRYTVSMTRANAHYFDVTMEVPLAKIEPTVELRLRMPVWTPGHYLVDDYGRNITEVKAYDSASGTELSVRKLEKSLWSVACRGVSKVRIHYPVYAFVYSVGTSYLDHLHGLINGASVYLYSENMKEVPVELALIPLPGWKVVSTGLRKVSEWKFSAPNYDVLVDSPLEVGNQEIRSFNVSGVSYEVSIFGSAPVDIEKFVGDIKGIVEQTTPVFANVPYDRYVFLVNFTDTTGGGLEHLNSTMCFSPRLRLVPKEEYAQSMGLFSHEFFHAWNVKRLRPAGLGPFDYTAEVYTKSLWIAEGVTSYYDDLILRRSGLYSVEEYLDVFVSNLNVMKSLPGSRYQSAEEASFDTWTKFYKPNENSSNVTSSYYTQGAVIGWMLDMVIRKASHGEKKLDDVMRKIYEDVFLKQDRGYTDEEFEATCVGLGGLEAKEVFDARVKGRMDVDYDRYLGFAGLRLTKKDEHADGKGFLGVKLRSEAGKTTVASELAGSPAEAMGLSVNDEILAIGGYRMSSDKISFSVETTNPGDSMKFTIARNGRLMDLNGLIGKRPSFEHRIQPMPGASDTQKALFKGWMLADWKPELKYPEYTKSPDRKPTFDYV
ncbi:MAG TPA: PDZ domain-containing protein [Nitrososphaerales archaeon]|nr:PDZ domain-containing protein [Nitrososphaerales archaeon]